MAGISNAIMVNLVGSVDDNDNGNEEDDGQKRLVNNISALHKEAMGNKDNKD